MKFKSDFLNTLSERGFLNQCSSFENLDNVMLNSKIKAYIGFDCTAKSLHIGSLIQIFILKYLQQFGHTPVILLGGGTTMVGDPTGKDESRKILTLEDINDNLLGIKSVLEKFVSFESENKAIMLNNYDWLSSFNYLDFLRGYGKEFTINRMLAFDSVKTRLQREQPLTFLEFNYMLLQAVDFLHLYKHHNTTLQMGGSDQWGNIINGVELIRRIEQKEVFGLTTPLLTKADGSKMGKTANGAVWLSANMFSPWDFYQYFRNVDDLDVIKFLKLFTYLPLNEIEKLALLKDREINEAKKILAFEITKIVHGEIEAQKSVNLAINTFENKELDANLPTYTIQYSNLSNGVSLVQVLTSLGLFESNSQGKKLIQNNAIKVNDISIVDINFKLSLADVKNDIIKISLSKKNHILLKVIN
jgi:tyrosyl-tRNA synthetase